MGWRHRCTCTHVPPPPPSPPPKARERTRKGRERARDGGGGGVRDVNYKPATSAGNWMALICICSCMIHQHHFTTVRNITFILQMLIYDKQRIWETSELRSIKDPVTFIFFCLHECVCAGASIHAHTHPSPLDLQLDVCMCVCLSMCAFVFGQLVLAICHTATGCYLPVRSRCDLNDG